MKTTLTSSRNGFTLVETVIAIGVLAVLLTGFMIVFAPAAAGIKKAISRQEADRLASTLEQELVTSRGTDPKPGFNKAFEWIRDSHVANTALLIYQYRGSLDNFRTDDGTPVPVINVSDQIPGKDYSLHTMVRRKNDPLFLADLPAVEGSVYLVKCTQLVYENGNLKPGDPGQIVDPKNPGDSVATADAYPEAGIAFKAEYFALSNKQSGYFQNGGSFDTNFSKFDKPVFTRNLAVAR